MFQEVAIGRRFHSRIFRKLRKSPTDFLLNEHDLRFAAQCERMRVDRNGSVLSILFITLPQDKQSPSDVALLARLLEGRLRLTDTAGILSDGRVVILLADTPEEGAWKVAADISEVYPPGPERPECHVIVYPDKSHRDDPHAVGKEAIDSSNLNGKISTGETLFIQPMPGWKRGFDLLFGAVGLVVAGPILLIASLAVKVSSPGPVFFTQEREGQGGRRFKMWKLRTMVSDAEERKNALLEFNQQDGPAFKMRCDPRRTTVGKFLRWSSIDELPQLWNVLRGDMSLVGPRPLPTSESLDCKNWQRRRLSVVPGITCIWQVSGRGKVCFDEWIRMDLGYADRVNPVHDAKLLLLTVPSLLVQKGMR